MIVWLFLVRGTLATFSLLNFTLSFLRSKETKLHDTSPWFYRQHVDVTIDTQSRWRDLTLGDCKTEVGNTVLVELKSFCFLPTAEEVLRISTEFILIGPFYDWHHVNFGPFSEQDTPFGANFLEARLTNKLAQCNATLDSIETLLESPQLRWWVTHQHVHTALRKHAKLRVMPIGFGYQEQRAADNTYKWLNEWKNAAIDALRVDAERDHLLLTTFQIHTNLFGRDGNDPRSELLRDLAQSATLRRFAFIERFNTSDAFMAAVRRSKFVLSPWGWGPDCFRHYESIALGAIPVVLSDWATDHALERLPHLVVRSWSELNESMLADAYVRIHSETDYELERLLRDYWLHRLFWAPSSSFRICRKLA